jgi:hypothetical protein
MLRTRLTLKPGRSGTRELVEKYGEQLVCVRYRYDDELGVRYKTVELIVDEKPWKPPHARYRPTELVHIKVAPVESQLRDVLKLLGGRYDRRTQTWLIAHAAAVALHITSRITDISHASTSMSPSRIPDADAVPQDRYDEIADFQWWVGLGSK